MLFSTISRRAFSIRADRSSSVTDATLPGNGRSWRMASGVFCATASAAPRSAAPVTPVESCRKFLRSTHISSHANVIWQMENEGQLDLVTFLPALIKYKDSFQALAVAKQCILRHKKWKGQ